MGKWTNILLAAGAALVINEMVEKDEQGKRTLNPDKVNRKARELGAEAKDALDAAGISVVRRWIAMEVPCSYGLFERMRLEVAAFDGVVENVDYGADVVLSALLPEEKAEAFAAHVLDVTAGVVEVLEAGEQFKDVPWREAVV